MRQAISFYVYALINPLSNQPFYIGKGKGYRCYKHLNETKENTENYKKWAYIQGIRNKGHEPIVEKLYTDLDEETAYYLEELLIWKYGRLGIDKDGILTNICASNRPPCLKGNLHPKYGTHLSSNIKAKISMSKTGVKVHTNEFKNKISQQMMGENKHFYGRKHSDISKNKMSIIHKGNEYRKNKKHYEETKAILQQHQIDKFKDENFVNKHKNSMDKCCKKYKVISPDGEISEIFGLARFAKEQGLPLLNLRAVVNRRKNGFDTNYKGWIVELIY